MRCRWLRIYTSYRCDDSTTESTKPRTSLTSLRFEQSKQLYVAVNWCAGKNLNQLKPCAMMARLVLSTVSSFQTLLLIPSPLQIEIFRMMHHSSHAILIDTSTCLYRHSDVLQIGRSDDSVQSVFEYRSCHGWRDVWQRSERKDRPWARRLRTVSVTITISCDWLVH